MRRGPTAALLVCLSLALHAEANSLYVSDQLLVGVHESQERGSAILELLPSGTRLEVVSREGDFVRVKTPGGTSGWVDGKYLAKEKPARTFLNELEARHQKLKQSLAKARQELEAQQGKPSDAADKKTREELEALRAQNAELRETVASAEIQLTELAKVQAAREAAVSLVEASAASELSMQEVALEPVTWGVLGGIFVLGFILGTYHMDYRQRKRHGGFRV